MKNNDIKKRIDKMCGRFVLLTDLRVIKEAS